MPSSFFRKMHNNKWRTFEVTEEDIEVITIEYFKTNMRLMERVLLNVDNMIKRSERLKPLELSKEMRDKMALALMDKMITPLHFAIENSLEEKLAKNDDF